MEYTRAEVWYENQKAKSAAEIVECAKKVVKTYNDDLEEHSEASGKQFDYAITDLEVAVEGLEDWERAECMAG